MKIVKHLDSHQIVITYRVGFYQRRVWTKMDFLPDSEAGYVEALRYAVNAVRLGATEVELMQYRNRAVLHNDQELRYVSQLLGDSDLDEELVELAHYASRKRVIGEMRAA